MKKTMLLLSVFAIMFVCAVYNYNEVYANNHTDTSFEFYFDINHGARYASSTGREKIDASSSYMYCNYANGGYVSGPVSYYGIVHGGYSSGGSFADCYYVNGGHTYHSTTYTFQSGTVKYMSNYVHETNRAFAKIYCTRNVVNATFRGVWSPDSI